MYKRIVPSILKPVYDIYNKKNTWQTHHPYHAEWRKPFPLTSRIKQGCQPLAHLFNMVGKSWSEKLGKEKKRRLYINK